MCTAPRPFFPKDLCEERLLSALHNLYEQTRVLQPIHHRTFPLGEDGCTASALLASRRRGSSSKGQGPFTINFGTAFSSVSFASRVFGSKVGGGRASVGVWWAEGFHRNLYIYINSIEFRPFSCLLSLTATSHRGQLSRQPGRMSTESRPQVC